MCFSNLTSLPHISPPRPADCEPIKGMSLVMPTTSRVSTVIPLSQIEALPLLQRCRMSACTQTDIPRNSRENMQWTHVHQALLCAYSIACPSDHHKDCGQCLTCALLYKLGHAYLSQVTQSHSLWRFRNNMINAAYCVGASKPPSCTSFRSILYRLHQLPEKRPPQF